MKDNSKFSQKVSALLTSCNITNPPVDIDKVAQFLKITVRKHPYKKTANLSGILLRDGEQVVIGVNADHHEHRQRFSIAHEIAHFLLHEGDRVFVDREYKINFRDSNSSSGTTDMEEAEANLFASLLLIPDEFIERDLSGQEIDLSGDSKKINDLAVALSKKYNVSPAAMILRLSSL